ncbi:MAG TPA: hypothetical protein PLN69_08180 [bacterium]|nr:hypothetical protein [bacterium]
MAVDKFPPAVLHMINENKDEFMKGLEEEPELFEETLKENNNFSIDYLRYRAFEKFIYHYKRMTFFIDKKTRPGVQAYELGGLSRSALDILEPLPPPDQFSTTEISGHRIFFIDDFDQQKEKFHFLFDGTKFIEDIVSRLDSDIEFETVKGEIIYKSYRSGKGFEAISSDATASLNRSLNFLVDAVYTLYESPNRITGSPFDPEKSLSLDRFRKKSVIKSQEVQAPAKPEAPVIPTVEMENKNGEDKDSSKE